jgi:SAM-dependent methyltransferase
MRHRYAEGISGAIKRPVRSVVRRSSVLTKVETRAREAWRRRRVPSTISFAEMTPEQAFRVAFNVVLRRDPDERESRDNLPALRQNLLSREELVQRLYGSVAFRFGAPFERSTLPQSLHMSRCEFIIGLPRARAILDIGGGDVTHTVGALVAMGYPYHFDTLTIVDLPGAERHPLYQSPEHATVQTHLGPVTYRYHSMSDLSAYADESFDLVYSGQSIEHVTEYEADHVFAEVRRILRPGAYFAFDTPNARITRLQQDEFVDADHQVEYTAAQLDDKLRRASFAVVERKGLNYVGEAAARNAFDFDEAARNRGVFSEAEDCYLLAYLCRKPG